MRNIKLFLFGSLLLLGLTQPSAFAAKSKGAKSADEIANIDRTQSVAVYPLGLLIGRFGVVYSFQVSDHVALNPGISASYFAAGLLGSKNYMFQIGPSFGARFFLSDTAFNTGWYVEPTLGVSYTQVGPDASGWGATLQGVGGYGWYWDSGFNLNLGAGIGYSALSAKIQNLGGAWLSYPHPVIDFSVGYAW